MSETPRTDEHIRRTGGQWSFVLRDFARTLERELAAAIRERDEARAVAEKHRMARWLKRPGAMGLSTPCEACPQDLLMPWEEKP